MKLPGGDNAIVEREKLAGYCLDPAHPRVKHKARVFATVLGFTAQHADELRAALIKAAATADAEPAQNDHFGSRYVIDLAVTGPKATATLQGTATLRSTWIIRHSESVPRLTTCYVK
ncbi:DUF6883 domain-containing protein [Aquisalimonas sp.]|uniref:DUF6883 domain-containing protein n=1 Tax=Aquisalimonas sp. TaxID=1872621 RepID=UPI003454C5BF